MNTVAEIISTAVQQLDDIAEGYWFQDTLYDYINMAIYEIIKLVPDAYPVDVTLSLAAGATQNIGTTSFRLLSVVENYTSNRAVSMMPKDVIDKILPQWRDDDYESGDAMFWIPEPADPRTFYVFPPMADATSKLNIIVSQMPEDVDGTADAFPLDTIYIPAAVDYLIYRALQEAAVEEKQVPNAANKAAAFLNKFYADLGLKAKTAS